MDNFPYKATPTGVKVHNSNAAIIMVEGPYASGKSCMFSQHVFYNMCAQPVAPDGKRYSRIGIVRSTYSKLKSTTRTSLMEVLPHSCGRINESLPPMKGHYEIALRDGTTVVADFELLALEKPEDVERLKSMNWTFAWINEADGVSYEIFIEVIGRVGRYPSMALGGCGYSGVLMDFNPPDKTHWLNTIKDKNYIEFENERFDVDYFKQPPAAFKIQNDDGKTFRYEMNPEAENVYNLAPGYYQKQIGLWLEYGRPDKVDRMFCLLDTPQKDGKAIHSDFKRELHVAEREIEPTPYQLVVVGYDTSGIHPAVAILQYQFGRWCILDELYGDNMSLETFVETMLSPLLKGKYRFCTPIFSCDPANPREQLKGMRATEHLKDYGFQISPYKITNLINPRITAVNRMLNKVTGGLFISPNCENIITGFEGGYHYKKRPGNDMEYMDEPEKNLYSHYLDAVQYGVLYIHADSQQTNPLPQAFQIKLEHDRTVRRQLV